MLHSRTIWEAMKKVMRDDGAEPTFDRSAALVLDEEQARAVLIACLALKNGFPELDDVIEALERQGATPNDL